MEGGQLYKRLQGLGHSIRNHLVNGIIPFWIARAEDRKFGGYLTNFDAKGRPLDTPEKWLNSQCGLVWAFSALHRKRPQGAELKRLAKVGADFLIDRFWDRQYGGWYWKVQRNGARLDDSKVLVGQAFAIHALGEYYLATGDVRGMDHAGKTFDLLLRCCADTLRGGFYESLDPDWSLSGGGSGGGGRKSLDAHWHLMEAFTTLYAASRQEVHRRRLLEVTDIVARRMVDPATGCGRGLFDLELRPAPATPRGAGETPALPKADGKSASPPPETPAAPPAETTYYGRNVELAWLMRCALQTAGADAAPYRETMRRLLDHAAQHGLDRECGGIFRAGAMAGAPTALEKESCQHAAALIGFLDGYESLGEPSYLDAFEHVWRFVEKHLIVPGVGEWRTLLDRQGRPLDANVGNPWKVAYHTGRAMIECTERIERILGRLPPGA